MRLDHLLRLWSWNWLLQTCLRVKKIPHIHFLESHVKQVEVFKRPQKQNVGFRMGVRNEEIICEIVCDTFDTWWGPLWMSFCSCNTNMPQLRKNMEAHISHIILHICCTKLQNHLLFKYGKHNSQSMIEPIPLTTTTALLPYNFGSYSLYVGWVSESMWEDLLTIHILLWRSGVLSVILWYTPLSYSSLLLPYSLYCPIPPTHIPLTVTMRTKEKN